MEKIVDKKVQEEYEAYMVRYAIETNWKRHTADVRDGLKTVQRRIIDSLANRLSGRTKLLKTARVVGDTIGNTHPHGDSSVKSAIKLLANWFDTKMPLLESESNMGSMQGESDAAERYTEVKLSQFCIDCVLSDLTQTTKIIDWKRTYDNDGWEPEYFPVAVPLLLINGTFGIGTGLKAFVPSHNLAEVIDATITLIKNPNAEVVLIPDQCMETEIIDTNWKSISNKGHGSYTARSIIDIEEHHGCYWLIIKSIPDMVYFDKGPLDGGVKYNILELIEEGKLPQITHIDEDSHGNNMRIIIKLKRGSDPEYVKQMLYKYTSLQHHYTVNFEALYEMQPVRMNYKTYLQTFIEQQRTTKFRLCCIQLQEYKTKVHELDAYIKIIESGKLTELIEMIRTNKSADMDEIVEFLTNTIGLTDIQASFMLRLNIAKISIGFLEKYKKELEEYRVMEKQCYDKIIDESLLDKDIINTLKEFKKKYGQPRKSRIISKDEATNIPKGIFKIIVTENNYIKKVSKNEYVGAYRGDNPKHIIYADNAEEILLFSAQGRVFNLPVNKIPVCEKGAIGVDARIMIKKLSSDIQAVMYVPDLKALSKRLNKSYIVTVTSQNSIKKMDLEDFLTVPLSGIIYTKINPGDFVKSISVVPDNLDIIIYSNKKALRVDMASIPKYHRNSIGVQAMSSAGCIDGLSILQPDATDIVVVTTNGKVNRFPIAGLAKSKRATAGSTVIKLAKGDSINSIMGVTSNDTIDIHGKNGITSLEVKEIKMGSSVSTGVKVLQQSDIAVYCTITR